MEKPIRVSDEKLKKVSGGLTLEESWHEYYIAYEHLKSVHNEFIAKNESLESYKNTVTVYVNNEFEMGLINESDYKTLMYMVDAFSSIKEYV